LTITMMLLDDKDAVEWRMPRRHDELARCQTLDCRGVDLVLTLLPPKEREFAREALQIISTRVSVKSVS
jgi:hypothetical protein